MDENAKVDIASLNNLIQMMQQNSISAVSVGDLLQNLQSMTIKNISKGSSPPAVNSMKKPAAAFDPSTSEQILPNGLNNSPSETSTQRPQFSNPFGVDNSNSPPEAESFVFKSPQSSLFTPFKVDSSVSSTSLPPTSLFSKPIEKNMQHNQSTSPLLPAVSNKNPVFPSAAHLEAGFAALLQSSRVAKSTTFQPEFVPENRSGPFSIPVSSPERESVRSHKSDDEKAPKFKETSTLFVSSNNTQSQAAFTIGSESKQSSSNHNYKPAKASKGKNRQQILRARDVLDQAASTPVVGAWMFNQEKNTIPAAAPEGKEKRAPDFNQETFVAPSVQSNVQVPFSLPSFSIGTTFPASTTTDIPTLFSIGTKQSKSIPNKSFNSGIPENNGAKFGTLPALNTSSLFKTFTAPSGTTFSGIGTGLSLCIRIYFIDNAITF